MIRKSGHTTIHSCLLQKLRNKRIKQHLRDSKLYRLRLFIRVKYTVEQVNITSNHWHESTTGAWCFPAQVDGGYFTVLRPLLRASGTGALVFTRTTCWIVVRNMRITTEYIVLTLVTKIRVAEQWNGLKVSWGLRQKRTRSQIISWSSLLDPGDCNIQFQISGTSLHNACNYNTEAWIISPQTLPCGTMTPVAARKWVEVAVHCLISVPATCRLSKYRAELELPSSRPSRLVYSATWNWLD